MEYRNEMQKLVSEKISSAKKDDNLVETYQILEAAGELIDAVEVDTANMQKQIMSEVESSGSKNPVNAILKMFGLRIVKENLVGDGDQLKNKWKKLICLKESEFDQKLSVLKSKLSTYEKEKRAREMLLDDQNTEKVRIIENMKKDIQNERNKYLSFEEGILLNLQQLISNVSEEENESVYKEILELINDIGITVRWDLNEGKLSNYFTVQKVTKVRESKTVRLINYEEEEYHVIKPCLLDKEGVRLKGLIYSVVKDE